MSGQDTALFDFDFNWLPPHDMIDDMISVHMDHYSLDWVVNMNSGIHSRNVFATSETVCKKTKELGKPNESIRNNQDHYWSKSTAVNSQL